MKFIPHKYQQIAIDKIEELPRCGLFLDMGLGKTVITLTAIEDLMYNRFEISKVLVIAPLRVAEDTWSRECEKWNHLKNLRIVKVLGSPQQRRLALSQEADVYIINRENVVWLTDELSGIGNEWFFDMVVVDELSSFKSPKAQRFKALKKYITRSSRVVGLTGTPAPNGLIDLWSQMYLIDSGERLGKTVTGYRERYFTPNQRNQTTIFNYKLKDNAEQAIMNKISDICISMKAEDWLDMPERIDSVIQVKMNSDEKAAYKTATAAGNFLKTLIEGFKSLKPAVAGATDAMKIHNTTVKANLYITLASAILSAVAAITTWIVTSKNATSATNDTTASVKKYTQAMESAKSTAENKEKSVNSEISMLKTLKGEYDELRNKTNLSTEEQKRLDNVAGEIAKTMGVTTDSLKNQSGAYKDLTSSVEDYIKQLKIKAQIENSQNILKEAYTVADEVTVEDVAKARSAYEAYKRELLSIKGKSEAEIEVLDSFSYADYSDDQIFNNKTNVMSIGGDWEKLKRLENTYAELDLQRSKALSTINEYEEKLKKALSEYENKTDATEKSTKSIEDETKAIEDLSKTMSEMSAKTTAVKNAEKEYKETQTLTASTLQAVIDKYPSLQEEVNKYMLGLTDTKSLIQSMKDVYQNDLNSYIGVISQKAGDSNIFYNQLINANANFVNKAKEQYGIDLLNFKNLQEAKAAMVANTVSKVQGPTQMYTGSFDQKIIPNQPNKNSWQYKVAENIVNSFIGSAISATTNYTDFFSSPSNSSSRSTSSSGSTSSSSSKKDNKYELADAAYSRLIDKRIEKIKKEADVAEKAKDKKIAAINAEIEARKRLNEDADRQNELEEINAQLEYSRLDKLSRRELERKKQDLLNEQTQINWERMMSDKKDKIESDYSKQEKSYSSAMDYLQKAAESAKNYFSKLAGTQTSSQIVNNNSDTRNIQIVSNALSNQQMLDKLLNALYSK